MRRFILAILFIPALALANPAGLWYSPQRDGAGLWLTADTGEGHWVQWQVYRRDRSSAVLTGDRNCTEFPCVIALHEPSAPWLGGDVDLGEPVGSAEIHITDSGLRLVYDVRAWDLENCSGTPGGIILAQCIGTVDMVLLAR